VTVDGDGEGVTDLSHALVAQAAGPVDQNSDGHALDRVEIDNAHAGNRIDAWLEHHLTRQASDSRGARGHQRPTESGNGGISTQHHDGSSADVGQLAPPELAASGLVGHEAAAAERNDPRSPHSSASVAGCSSYAA